ncbi:MAG: DUF4330 domain-containing protein [Anaerotignaceae bacterium]
MKFIDEKGKLFGIANAIDICVVLIVVLLIGGAYYKFSSMNKSSGGATMQPVSYEVTIERVRDFSYNNIQVGDTIFDKTSGNSIGTITNVEKEQAYDKIRMPDGSIAVGPVENRINIKLTVEGEGVVSSSGTFVNRTYELLVGSKKKFFTKYLECEGSVSEIF